MAKGGKKKPNRRQRMKIRRQKQALALAAQQQIAIDKPIKKPIKQLRLDNYQYMTNNDGGDNFTDAKLLKKYKTKSGKIKYFTKVSPGTQYTYGVVRKGQQSWGLPKGYYFSIMTKANNTGNYLPVGV